MRLCVKQILDGECITRRLWRHCCYPRGPPLLLLPFSVMAKSIESITVDPSWAKSSQVKRFSTAVKLRVITQFADKITTDEANKRPKPVLLLMFDDITYNIVEFLSDFQELYYIYWSWTLMSAIQQPHIHLYFYWSYWYKAYAFIYCCQRLLSLNIGLYRSVYIFVLFIYSLHYTHLWALQTTSWILPTQNVYVKWVNI